MRERNRPAEGIGTGRTARRRPVHGRVRLLLGWAACLVLAMSASSAPAAQRLHLFIWSEYLDPEVVKEFERRFDARVTIDLYEDSESMLAKIQAGGTALYDVVVPPDHLVPPMIKLGLLAPLRKANLPNLANLEPRFAGPPYDPKNEYTVPYQWGTVGLYYRLEPGKSAPDSWSAIFDRSRQPGPFVLIDSMRDAIGAALKYRGHGLNATDAPSLKEARDLLIDAKRRSTAFEGSVGGRNRVLSRTAMLAIIYSTEAARGMADDPGTGYSIPKEGSQIWIDNLAIPAKAPNRDLAERFLNFVLEPEVGARLATFNRAATPNRAARAHLTEAILKDPTIYPPSQVVDRLEPLVDLGAKSRLYDQVWTQVKGR